MNYNEFKNALKNELVTIIGKASAVAFGTVEVNGKKTESLDIYLTEDPKPCSATLDALFSLHSQFHMAIEDIAQMLLKSAESTVMDIQLDTSNIVYRLSSRREVENMLDHIPHIPFYDMVISFVYVNDDNDYATSYRILTNADMENNNLTKSQLVDHAKENTFRIYPSRADLLSVHMLRNELLNPKSSLQEFLRVSELIFNARKEPKLFWASALDYRFGCTVILDYDFLGKMANRLQHDLLILPSSDRDVVIMPWLESTNIAALQKDVNADFGEADDSLPTKTIFCFNKNTRQLEPLE